MLFQRGKNQKEHRDIRHNPIKHDGVTFQQAIEVFFDPFLIVVDASRNYEKRDAVIGLDRKWNMLFVVYMEVEGDSIRIISARKATCSPETTI